MSYLGNQKGQTGTGGGTSGPAEWGQIQGTLSQQTDLQTELDGKATAAQGSLADTALQPEDVGTYAYLNFNDANLVTYNDIGNLLASNILSLTKRYNVGFLFGETTDYVIQSMSPESSRLEPARFIIKNTDTVAKTLAFDQQNFVLNNAVFERVVLMPGQRVDFTVMRDYFSEDPEPKYFVFYNDEKPFSNLGDISGAVTASLQYQTITAHLKADAVINFSDGLMGPIGGSHKLMLRATSDVNPTYSSFIDAGFELTLSGASFVIDGLVPFPSVQVACNGKETILSLISLEAGVYRVENLTRLNVVKNLGEITTPLVLDIRHAMNIGELKGATDAVLISGVSPDVEYLEPAHFTIVNNGSVTKTITWDASLFSLTGSLLNQVTIPIGHKLDFDVRRNPLNPLYSYEVKVGDVNYNQTASGLATTWNPSDAGTNPVGRIAVVSSNKTTYLTSSGTGLVRGFGGKSTGKWRLALQCLIAPTGSSSYASTFVFGLAPLALQIPNYVGSIQTSYGLRHYRSTSTTAIDIHKYSNNVLTTIGSVALKVGDILGVLVDFDANKIWFTLNNAAFGADPNAGTGEAFTIQDGVVLYPALSLYMSSANQPGSWMLLDEIQDPYVSTWPTFKSWTA